MAGFDISFAYKETDRVLLESMLAAMRRRARVFRIRMTAQVFENVAVLTFNGQSFGIDILLERIRRDLPTIAEAVTTSRTPASRRKLANGLVDIITRARVGLYERYESDEDYRDWIPTLRCRNKTVFTAPYQIFPYKDIKLFDRMIITMEMLASWHFNEIAPEVLVEEIHTASELLMRSVLKVSSTQRFSFPQLIEGCFRRHLLKVSADFSSLQDERILLASGPAALEDFLTRRARDTLKSLSSVRNLSRHAGEAGAREWLDVNFLNVVAILENLSLKVTG